MAQAASLPAVGCVAARSVSAGPESLTAAFAKNAERPGAGEANRTPDPNLGNVLALFKKWLKSKLLSLLDDET
jgi:hypothetical protein